MSAPKPYETNPTPNHSSRPPCQFNVRNGCKYLKITHLQSKYLANSVNNTHITLRALLSNTDTILRARLIKSRLLSPIQYLPIYIFSFFNAGASRLPPRVFASGPKSCGGNNVTQPPKATVSYRHLRNPGGFKEIRTMTSGMPMQSSTK